MSGFQAVNTTLTVAELPPRLEESTPTTPRPALFAPQAEKMNDTSEDAAKTPTRDSFGGMANQRPLPTSPFAPSHSRADSKIDEPTILKREGSHRSSPSVEASQDTEMGDAKDDVDVSDNESNSDSRPSKKKKGQRFFCTEFPPCQLSFTRSEHLARHIRKHTGERPFQCHCSRRFSRLDNLRQHAQTVHVNEDIPGDSLAATGTRFQRQIRTDRVRPPAGRSRASTLGSQGSHSRGHSRNLSSSSITSISTTSSLGGDDIIRRQTPMTMTSEGAARARLSLDTYNTATAGSPGSQQYYSVGAPSPSGYSTPTSTTFSQGTGSPRFSSGLHSPVSTAIPRSVNFESRPHGRRLSVPSGNPFTPPNNTSYPSPYPSSVQSTSGASSIFASPTSSVFSHSRRESTSSIDADWRRRTWHSGTHTGLIARPGASGLNQYQLPETSRPVFATDKGPSAQTRLPGIESFDHVPPQPAIARRAPSPMQIDSLPPPAAASSSQDSTPAGFVPERNNRMSWDSTLQRGLTNLEIAQVHQSRDAAAYAQYASRSIEPTPRPRTTSHITFQDPRQGPQPPPDADRARYSDQPVTPRKNKRHAWYNGPVTFHQPQSSTHVASPSATGLRTSPDGSSSSDGVPTPSNSSANELHPAIVHSNGYVESPSRTHTVDEQTKMNAPPMHYPPSFSSNSIPQYTSHPHVPHQAQNATYALQHAQQAPPRPIQTYSAPVEPANDFRKLEALVAVATQEDPNCL